MTVGSPTSPRTWWPTAFASDDVAGHALVSVSLSGPRGTRTVGGAARLEVTRDR